MSRAEGCPGRTRDHVIEQTFLTATKDQQAMKIFDWAAGAASLRMAYYGLKLGLFQAIAGAAGGLGAALLALGGTRVSGATVVAEATGLAAEVAAADVVVTGEGKFDAQTLRGKVVAALHEAASTIGARGAGAPTIVLAGQVALGPGEIRAAGVAAAYAIVDIAGSVEVAMNDAENHLVALATSVASDFRAADGPG